jgi:hypothetical protein
MISRRSAGIVREKRLSVVKSMAAHLCAEWSLQRHSFLFWPRALILQAVLAVFFLPIRGIDAGFASFRFIVRDCAGSAWRLAA